MKIYTKGGDDGTTSIIGGRRLSKCDLRIEAYGAVDELISWLGLIRDMPDSASLRDDIIQIQDNLMTLAASLATDPENPPEKPLTPPEKSVSELESLIDRLEEGLPQLTSFILPGGGTAASYCHIARSVCRRAERRAIALAQTDKVPAIVLRLLNRLSDLLFVLARYYSYSSGYKDVKWE